MVSKILSCVIVMLQLTETEKSERGFGLGKRPEFGFRLAKLEVFWIRTVTLCTRVRGPRETSPPLLLCPRRG